LSEDLPVNLIVEGLQVRTAGLAAQGHPELIVKVSDAGLIPESEALLLYITAYLQDRKVKLRPNETMGYGYWLIKFKMAEPALLEVWEYNAQATKFIRGATRTLTYWRDQHKICEKFKGEFSPPRPDKLAVISEGILEGDNTVQGVRYPSPEHMSGWWLTTNRYNGSVESLKTTHLYHVTAARPDLTPYIALPYGFRFEVGEREDVWFDGKVATSS
jgi:hypothetical protein